MSWVPGGTSPFAEKTVEASDSLVLVETKDLTGVSELAEAVFPGLVMDGRTIPNALALVCVMVACWYRRLDEAVKSLIGSRSALGFFETSWISASARLLGGDREDEACETVPATRRDVLSVEAWPPKAAGPLLVLPKVLEDIPEGQDSPRTSLKMIWSRSRSRSRSRSNRLAAKGGREVVGRASASASGFSTQLDRGCLTRASN